MNQGVNSSSNQSLPKEISSSVLLQRIKKKPYTQTIDDTDYTYSILAKKQKTFVFTHDRFLILKGTDTLGYSNFMPEEGDLPFKTIHDIPKMKSYYPLVAIEAVLTDLEKLTIEFSVQDRPKWEFLAPSKGCANEWKRKIEEATNKLQKIKVGSNINQYQFFTPPKYRNEQPNQ